MSRTVRTVSRGASRAKVGGSILACVLAALAAGQVSAASTGYLVIAAQEVPQ